jgi:hypothetical protein
MWATLRPVRHLPPAAGRRRPLPGAGRRADPCPIGGVRGARRARAAALTSGGGVLGYDTAARLHALEGLGRFEVEDELPHLVLGAHRTRAQRRGLHQHFRRLSDDEEVQAAGFRVTSVRRTLADLVPRPDHRTAVFLLDSALHVSLIELAEIPPQVPERVLAVVDGRAESTAESLARLRSTDAGIAPEALQYVVLDGRDFVARLDLAWPARKVALEVDSRHHDEPAALYRDRARQNRLVTSAGPSSGSPGTTCSTTPSVSWRRFSGPSAYMASSRSRVECRFTRRRTYRTARSWCRPGEGRDVERVADQRATHAPGTTPA